MQLIIIQAIKTADSIQHKVVNFQIKPFIGLISIIYLLEHFFLQTNTSVSKTRTEFSLTSKQLSTAYLEFSIFFS